jgi:UDP-2,3-diacylglucosamine hydrolase
MAGRIYFISDVHLGVPNGRRSAEDHQDALVSFLRHLETDDQLFIVGDLFDFWFEYRSSIPTTGARVVFELYALGQKGISVTILPGNHDIWLGSYLRNQVGLDIQSNPLSIEVQGKKIYITHGDEFGADWKFRLSRAILKSRLCIWLFRLLHPDLGVALGKWTSHASDTQSSATPADDRRVYIEAAERLIHAGHDIVLCGHYHRGVDQEIMDGRLIVLGNWVRSDTYAILEGGDIRLMKWMGDRGEPFEDST